MHNDPYCFQAIRSRQEAGINVQYSRDELVQLGSQKYASGTKEVVPAHMPERSRPHPM
jgi:hypothetical protein